jgi:hypothetical protein
MAFQRIFPSEILSASAVASERLLACKSEAESAHDTTKAREERRTGMRVPMTLKIMLPAEREHTEIASIGTLRRGRILSTTIRIRGKLRKG